MSGTVAALNQPGRYYALDSLRAAMMLLGILLHAGCSYTTLVIPVWAFKDQSTSPLFDLSMLGIHAYRMPVFFVMSGFFSCMLWRRMGPAGFAKHRARRVLLPFIAGWLVLHVPVVSGFVYGNASLSGEPLQATIAHWTSGAFLGRLTTMHLWFLY
jgi:fucose 4-O-acetylase-like acetyltransferase